MRKDATTAENLLWQAIRNNQLGGLKFKRQLPILDYIVDFVCLRVRLIVELDGGQHADSIADKMRDERLCQAGFKTLRFWNDEIIGNLDGVCSQILYEWSKR
jgi:very-short-patch-repair endonuclease